MFSAIGSNLFGDIAKLLINKSVKGDHRVKSNLGGDMFPFQVNYPVDKSMAPVGIIERKWNLDSMIEQEALQTRFNLSKILDQIKTSTEKAS